MKKWPWFTLSVSIIILDQLAKYGAVNHLTAYQPKAVFPMFNLTLAYNRGAGFSFLDGAGSWSLWFFTAFSFIVSVVLVVWLLRLPNKAKMQCLGLSLILGGALGNLYDRATLGYVIDFIDVYYKNHHWAVFNVADSAICLGAFFLILTLRSATPIRS